MQAACKTRFYSLGCKKGRAGSGTKCRRVHNAQRDTHFAMEGSTLQGAVVSGRWSSLFNFVVYYTDWR